MTHDGPGKSFKAHHGLSIGEWTFLLCAYGLMAAIVTLPIMYLITR